MSYRDEYKPLHEKAPQIAAALGDGWEYVPPPDGEVPWYADLRKATNNCEHYTMHLGLHLGLRGNRIEINGRWPEDISGQKHSPYKDHPGITVSLDRSPEAIAADMRRRFLSDYMPLFDQYRAQAEATNQQIFRREAALELLAGDLGITIKRNEHTGRIETDNLYPHGKVRKVHVHYSGETASFEINDLSIETTRAILLLLGESFTGGSNIDTLREILETQVEERTRAQWAESWFNIDRDA